MVTATILAKNEEKNIERCLRSLQWCDEILVVDDDSTDNTVKIAKKYGARVVTLKLDGDFAKQRNFGLNKAKNKWVLFVDSDEEILPSLAREIQEAIKKIEFKGFLVRRHDFLWGKKLVHGDVGRFNYIRLGLRGAGEWKRRVDEVWKINGRVGQLKNPILHYPHPTLSEFLEEINYKSTLNALQLFEEGQKTRFIDWFKPVATFFRSWIVKGGFRDGMPGFILALLMSLHSFFVRSKLYLLTQRRPLQIQEN